MNDPKIHIPNGNSQPGQHRRLSFIESLKSWNETSTLYDSLFAYLRHHTSLTRASKNTHGPVASAQPSPRRKFLQSGCAIALMGAVDALMGVRTVPEAGASTHDQVLDYWGNPNVKITAIDAGKGIVASRTSGQIPAFVHVSASSITCTGTFVDTDGNPLPQFVINAWEDLEYRWDFGDPQGVETFKRPTDGRTVNANSDQIGPDAVYVYRTPGTKTITLTIRGKNGDSFTTAVAKMSFEVSVFNQRKVYFDSRAPAGGNGTIQSPYNQFADLAANITSGRDIYIKRGSVFSWTGQSIAAGGNTFAQNVRIQAYGTGARPLLRNTTSAAGGGIFRWGGRNVVISDIDFRVTGPNSCTGNGVFVLGSITGTECYDFYLDRCSVTRQDSSVSDTPFLLMGQATGPSGPSAWNINRHGIWGCDFLGTGSPGKWTHLFLSVRRWFFMVGGSVGGGHVGDNVLEHHIYPNVRKNSLYKWIDFNPVRNSNFCINVNWDSEKDDPYCEWVYIGECDFSGAQRCVDAGNGSAQSGETQYLNYVFERNTIHHLTAHNMMNNLRARSQTVRDNHVWACPQGNWYVGENYNLRAKLYRNKIHVASDAPYSGRQFHFDQIKGVPFLFTDNIIQNDKPSNVCFLTMNWATAQTRGTVIDRNQYFRPNSRYAQNFQDDDKWKKTFYQMQRAGFDLHSRDNEDPRWIDPGKGDFRTR